MSLYPDCLARLLKELCKLPGIGEKTALRLAFAILRWPENEALSLAKSIEDAKKKISYCSACFNLTEEPLCKICKDESRDKGIICIVEGPADLIAIERTREYRGVYHILHGVLSPLEGVNPEDLKVKELMEKLKRVPTKEVIIATDADAEGEATALYLTKLLKNYGVKVSRIAHGLPAGGNLEYADEVTLSRALEGRREVF